MERSWSPCSTCLVSWTDRVELCCDGALSPEGEYNWLSLLVLLNSVTKVTPLKKQRLEKLTFLGALLCSVNPFMSALFS